MMECNATNHLTCEITLDSGRSITIEILHQQETYDGLIEGIPQTSLNDLNVKSALMRARTKCTNDSELLLIVPDRRDYRDEPGDMEIFLPLRRGRPEWLPLVQCIGRFKSSTHARNHNMDCSYLVVVWFQDESAPPIDNAVIEKMKRIDWESSPTGFSG